MEPETRKFLIDLPFDELCVLYKRSLKADQFGLLLTIFASFGLLLSIGETSQSKEILVIPFCLSLILIAAAVMIFSRTGLGQIIGIAVCILFLLIFPFGTIISLYFIRTFAVTLHIFGPGRIKHKYIAAALMVRQRHMKCKRQAERRSAAS